MHFECNAISSLLLMLYLETESIDTCLFVCVWLQRHSVAKRQEEDDFGFARELRDREKRLQALEQQLEQRARSDCFYSRKCFLLMID